MIDVSSFHLSNVIDTCSIWNLLASTTLRRAARTVRCSFCVTQFVEYEALHKPRTSSTTFDHELQDRLRDERTRGEFQTYSLDIEDLQDVEILENRQKLSKGELSSIAFAKKTQQAFLTDDQRARKLAASVLPANRIQTIPHLAGHLFFTGILVDHEKNIIKSDQERFCRPLGPYIDESYLEAMRCRSLVPGTGN